MNERLQLALIVGCGFVIGLEAPNAARLVFESWTGPYAAPANVARVEFEPPAAVDAFDELVAVPDELVPDELVASVQAVASRD